MPKSTLLDLTIPFRLEHDSLAVGVDTTGAWAEATFLVDYFNTWEFLRQVAGIPKSFTSGGAFVQANVPLQFWDNTQLYCDSVVAKAIGTNLYANGVACSENQYSRSKITLHFRTPTWNYDDAVLVTTTCKFSANFVTLPRSVYKFADGTPTDSSVGRLLPQVEFSVTNHRCLYVNTGAAMALVGNINVAPATLPDGSVAAAGNLMFGGLSTTDTVSMLGSPLKTAEYAFVYRPVNWNYFLHPTTGNFEVVTDGTGNPVYPSGDFTSIGLY